MPRRSEIPRLGLAISLALFGLVVTKAEYPALHAIQILLPFASGIAAGVLIGRRIQAAHATA